MRFTAALLLMMLALAGCTSETNDSGDEPQEPIDPVPEDNSTAMQDPITIEGSAVATAPAANQVCARNGLDGEIHDIGTVVSGWSWAIEPAADWGLYWYGSDGYIEGGAGETGTAPDGADTVEVCNIGTEPNRSYTLTLSPPDA